MSSRPTLTDLGILWKAVTAFLPESSAAAAWRFRCGLVVLAVVLIGCSADNSTTETLPTTPLVVPEISEELVVPPDLPNPLKPLPSATDVQDRVPEGRSDPFQPLVSGAKASVILNGVLIVGGQQRALVELSDRSGTICVGPGGLCLGQAKTEQLLPPSWSLLSIDVQRGCITLSRRGKTQAPTCMLEHKR